MKSFFFIAVLSLTLITFQQCDKINGSNPKALKFAVDSLRTVDSINKLLLINKAEEALTFCKQQNFNTEISCLINMKVHSGKYRFYVWDFKKNVAIDSGLVSHGCGTAPWSNDGSAENPVFSNVPDSHLSSLGKYKIGQRDFSQWGVGIKYNLHGLEATNNKALERYIVFHSWDIISDTATYPIGSPESWGCPAVSNAFFMRIDAILKQAQKPVLMWIFNE